MYQWVNVTDTFSGSQRYYKNTYLEICEVFDEVVEVSLFLRKIPHMRFIFRLELCMELFMRKKKMHTKNESR